MTDGLHICFVTANTFEFDSRTLRAAQALAADGHRVTVVALQGLGLAVDETLENGILLVRPDLDRRVASAFRPLPTVARNAIARVLGFDPDAVALPPRGPGVVERIRGPLRRAAEILAYRRRVGPWVLAALAAAPDADIFSAKALVVLPVVREAAGRNGARFVYDIADLHIESGRLARLPGPLKSYLYRRERQWMAEAAALTTVTEPMADEIVRRFGVARPTVVMNCRPRWRSGDDMPTTTRLREAVVAAGGRADAPILLYQGAFREDQGIEELLAATEGGALRDVPLVIAFMGFGRLQARLRAAATAAQPGRIVILPPVPSTELLEWTAGADLAFVGAPPRTVNLGLTIPNKLFESLMAGVPVVVAGGTAVARLVTETGAGVVVQPWSAADLGLALTAALTALPDDRLALRRRARSAALERYNWETEQAGLVATYRALQKRGAAAGAADGLRVVLLLNNAFTADSRSWKLATSLTEAGCRVTVVARPGEGLPWTDERDGFLVLRVAQPRSLSWLPAPGLPTPTPVADAPATTAGSARARLRDTIGRGAQAGRYLLRTRAWATAIDTAVGASPVDIWQSEGLVTLPVALRLRSRRGGKVVYDSRDIHLESARFALLPKGWRDRLARRERRWAQAADAVVTVNAPYAEHLERTLGRPMTLVFNGPLPFEPPDPPERRFHRDLVLPPTAQVALILGAVVEHRGIDEAATAIGELPDVHLVVVGEGGAKLGIQVRAAGLPHADRVHFLPAVPPDEIPAWTAAADVAVIPIQPSTLNHRLTTPTRLFDAMGAGVPVVAADLPGMAEIVRETGIGVLVDPTSPESIAAGIRDVLDASPERRAAYRDACLAAARGPYAWERGVERLLALYRSA